MIWSLGRQLKRQAVIGERWEIGRFDSGELDGGEVSRAL
jgi:hypothetical protein